MMAAAVIDRMTGDVVSRHQSYGAADKAASKRGWRYAVKIISDPVPTRAEMMARLRKERIANGLVELRLWITPEHKDRVIKYVARLKHD